MGWSHSHKTFKLVHLLCSTLPAAAPPLLFRTGELLGWSHWHKTFKLGHFFGWLAVPMVAAESAGACIAVGDAVAVSKPRLPGEAMAPCVNTAAA